MTCILHIDASGNHSRSLSRRLSRRFVDAWVRVRPGDRVIRRDLMETPPPFVDEPWMIAAFGPEDVRGTAPALAWSNAAVAEVEAADVIVLGTPMYNYGMPAVLKAWFDQVIRIGRSFTFDRARGDFPIEPALHGKRLVVLSARGEFGFGPGGVRAGMNHLDSHLATVARYIGVVPGDVRTVAVEYQEFGDDRHVRSLAAAEAEAERLASDMAKVLPAAA